MRFLSGTFLTLSFTPPAFLALAFAPIPVGYWPLACSYFSLITSVLLTLIGLTWWLFSADLKAEVPRAVVLGTCVAGTPLIYVGVMAVAGLIRRH